MTAHATTVMRRDLAGVLRHELHALLRHLRRGRRGQSRAVHQARIASRRLREALPVAARAASDVKGQQPDRDVRRVARALGPVRELDVTLAEFAHECGVRKWTGPVFEQIGHHLEEERERRRRTMEAKLDRLDLERLEDRTRALADACEARPATAWVGHLTARLRKRARRFEEALQAAGMLYVPERIHRVRIAGKKLRYTLELARSAAGAPVSRQIATLKRLQDLLGRLHDLQVLEEYVRAVAADAAADRNTHVVFERVQRQIEDECRILHARFLGKSAQWRRLPDYASREVPLLIVRRSKMLKARPASTSIRPSRARAATA